MGRTRRSAGLAPKFPVHSATFKIANRIKGNVHTIPVPHEREEALLLHLLDGGAAETQVLYSNPDRDESKARREKGGLGLVRRIHAAPYTIPAGC
jgi:hypothetical protein